jgi:hypothetical protein
MAAQFVAFGKILVPAAGQPVQIQAPPAMNPPSCHALIIEALPGNTGKIYVGLAGLTRATLQQVLIILPIPTVNLLPTFSIALTVAGNAINVGSLWVDADVAGEGVLVSALVA